MIVEKDEKEVGIRALLNLGHTFGHALEKITDYKVYGHGEAVVMGTVAASILANKNGYITKGELHRILSLYKKLNIYKPFPLLDAERVYNAMLNDKKVMHGKLRLILPAGLGHSIIVDHIDKEEIVDAVRKAQEYNDLID